VHTPIHRWLFCLLLLLGLVAGGTMLSPVAMPEGDTMTDMSDTVCTNCGKAAAAVSCEAICMTLPGIEPVTLDLELSSSQAPWSLSAVAGVTHFVAPEPSPPRA
jgi:hypothetical protein